MHCLKMKPSSEGDSSSLASTMSKTDLVDRIVVMQRQEESKYYRYRDYLRGSRREYAIDPESRRKMCEWCYQVVDMCEFSRSSVATSFNYLDRFLMSSSPRARKALKSKREYQLAAMTCLYLSVKLYEPMVMDTQIVAAISNGCYSESEITDMEMDILSALSWKLNGPTTHDFVSHMVALLPPAAYDYNQDTAMALLDFSRLQAELAVLDYDLCLQKPSTVAMAAVLNSVNCTERRFFSKHSRKCFLKALESITGINPYSAHITEVREHLLELFAQNSGYELPQATTSSAPTQSDFVDSDVVSLSSDGDMMKDSEEQPSPVSVTRYFTSPCA